MQLRNYLVPSICTTLLSVLTLSADTIPGGDVSGTWFHSNSPYYINGNITVQNADTLVIEPGVDVIYLGNYYFRGYGVLTADGTEADSIRFLAQDTALGWQGIKLAYRHHRLSYCAVRNSKDSGIHFMAIGCTLTVNHCRITDNRSSFGGGIRIWANSATLKIKNSVIARNTAASDLGGLGGGIYIYLNGYLVMDSCLVDSNRARLTSNATQDTARGGGICTDMPSIYHLSVTNSAITNNAVEMDGGGWSTTGGAMFIAATYDTPAVIANCLIKGNRSDGYIVGTGPCAGIYWWGSLWNKLRISHCEISQNENLEGVGTSGVQANGPVDVINCTFADNPHIVIYANTANARTRVVNSIFARNGYAIGHWNVAPPTEVCGYNLFNDPCGDSMPPGFGVIDRVNRNGDSCDCYYNLFNLDPMFVDTVNGDYRLTGGSPCIDAGDSTLPYDPDMTIADMGCYWFNQIGIEERTIARHTIKSTYTGATIFRGPLILPKGRNCRIFDITGRSVTPDKIEAGIYFIEVDGQIAQKVIKIR